MKKLVIMVCMVCLILSACGGNIRNTDKIYTESAIYSEQDILAAMDIALDHFTLEFDGCTMISIWYDEARSLRSANEWAAKYDADQAIILISCFDVDSSGGDGSLNPNSRYNNWQWILTRDEGEAWKLQTWGYG